MSKRVLLLSTTTGYQVRSFGEAAERLGIQLAFATDRCDRLEDPWWDQAIPVRWHDEAPSVATILERVREDPPAGVLAVGDRPTIIAARVAQALGLPGNPPDAACASRNKLATRMALRSAGLRTPAFELVPVDREVMGAPFRVPLPCVVKPLALSGSRGVIRADTPEERAAAFERVRTLLRTAPDIRQDGDSAHDAILIETYIPGREFAVEGVLTHGRLRAFAIFDKPDPLDGPFFEETIYVTPSRAAASVQQDILAAVGSACSALKLHHGPVHAECRVNDEGVYVLEVAARPIGGLCSRALRFEGSVSLEEVLLRHACGEDIADVRRETRASGVMMIPIPRRGVYRGVDGVEAASSVPGVDLVTITAKQDALLVPLPEGRSYLGFVFASGAAAADVEASLREAHARLAFRIDRPLDLATPALDAHEA